MSNPLGRTMTALESMATYVARDVRGCVPEATRATAKLHLTDTIGAWIAGSRTPEGRALMTLRGNPSSNNLPDVGTPCALARLSEIDDIHLASTTTPGAIVIPAALTIAAAQPGTSSAALLEAIVAGIEAMVRLGVALGGPTVLYRGIWPTYVTAPFGVAVAASRLYNLDAAQTAHALALALTVASPGVGHHNAATTSRWLAIGHQAQSGLVAAHAARNGFTSDLNFLDGSFFHNVYGIKPELDVFRATPDQRPALDGASLKPWCGARQTIAATQALIELMDEGVQPEAITSIEVRVPPPYRAMIDHGVKSGDRASHLTSGPYRLSLAACDPAQLYDVAASPLVIPERIHTFMRMVSVAADDSLLAHYPNAWPAHLVIRTVDGMHQRLVIHVPGDPERPFDERQVIEKFKRVVGAADLKRTERILATCGAIFKDDRAAAELVSQLTQATA